jgi:hypothetical protein
MEEYKKESERAAENAANYAQLEKEYANEKNSLKDEIAKLKATQPQPKTDELDDICKKMLVALANFNGPNGITDGELIQSLGLQKAKGDYLFDQLIKRKFVDTDGANMNRGTFWQVTDTGREYMAKLGLLDAKPAPLHPSAYDGGFDANPFGRHGTF